MAEAGGAFALPPGAGTQLARLLPLAADVLFGDLDEKGLGFHLADLAVPPFDIFEVDGETDGDSAIESRAQQRPAVTGAVVAPPPKGKKDEEHNGAGDQNFVRGDELHGDIK